MVVFDKKDFDWKSVLVIIISLFCVILLFFIFKYLSLTPLTPLVPPDKPKTCILPVGSIMAPQDWKKPPIIKKCISSGSPFTDWFSVKGVADTHYCAMYGNTITAGYESDFHINNGINMIVFNFPNQVWSTADISYDPDLLKTRICPTLSVVESHNKAQQSKKKIAIPYMSLGDSDFNAAVESNQLDDFIYRTVELCKLYGFKGVVVDIENDHCCSKSNLCTSIPSSKYDRWGITAAMGKALIYNNLELHANGWQNWEGQVTTGFYSKQIKEVVPLLTSMQIMTYGTYRPPGQTHTEYTISQINDIASDYIKNGIPKNIIMFGIAPYYSVWHDIDGGHTDCLGKCQGSKSSTDCDSSVKNVDFGQKPVPVLTAGYTYRPTYANKELTDLFLDDTFVKPSNIQVSKNLSRVLYESYTYSKSVTYNNITYNNVFTNVLSPKALYSRGLFGVLGGFKGTLVFRKEFDNKTDSNATSHVVDGFYDALTEYQS